MVFYLIAVVKLKTALLFSTWNLELELGTWNMELRT
jgi:hypothetical protein